VTPPLPPDPDTVRCPTCRASQPWSDSCRRCQSDLRLLRDFAESYQRLRRSALRSLRSGDARSARLAARSCASLCPSIDALRLLAVCSLIEGDPDTALALAQRLPDQD
jgi:hypothetical protein